jgi:endonuclease I
VPRAVLLRYMPDAPTRVRNGACANPLNFAAEAPRLNQARGELAFDLDDDPVARRVAVVQDGRATDHVGIDRDGQWVPPRRSRGDIARTVLYMMFVYRLRFTPDRRWLAWAEADPPSQTERAFSRWTRRRWGIGNPLVERPGLLYELSDALPWR